MVYLIELEIKLLLHVFLSFIVFSSLDSYDSFLVILFLAILFLHPILFLHSTLSLHSIISLSGRRVDLFVWNVVLPLTLFPSTLHASFYWETDCSASCCCLVALDVTTSEYRQRSDQNAFQHVPNGGAEITPMCSTWMEIRVEWKSAMSKFSQWLQHKP